MYHFLSWSIHKHSSQFTTKNRQPCSLENNKKINARRISGAATLIYNSLSVLPFTVLLWIDLGINKQIWKPTCVLPACRFTFMSPSGPEVVMTSFDRYKLKFGTGDQVPKWLNHFFPVYSKTFKNQTKE